MNEASPPLNEIISGLIAVILALAVTALAVLGRAIPEVLSGAFLLVMGFYFRAQGFNAGVDYQRKSNGDGANANLHV